MGIGLILPVWHLVEEQLVPWAHSSGSFAFNSNPTSASFFSRFASFGPKAICHFLLTFHWTVAAMVPLQTPTCLESDLDSVHLSAHSQLSFFAVIHGTTLAWKSSSTEFLWRRHLSLMPCLLSVSFTPPVYFVSSKHQDISSPFCLGKRERDSLLYSSEKQLWDWSQLNTALALELPELSFTGAESVMALVNINDIPQIHALQP